MFGEWGFFHGCGAILVKIFLFGEAADAFEVMRLVCIKEKFSSFLF